jgi:molybdopterin synthase sulfur carrier subunit
MNISIKLLKPFSEAVDKNHFNFEFKGKTLDDLLDELILRYPRLKNELYSKKNELTEYVVIFVNDKPFSVLNGLKTKLKNNDEILFFIPVSGG